MNYPQGGHVWHQTPPPNMPPQVYPGQPYAPGYYAPPPPPKKSRAWLWVLLAILTVIVLAVGGYVVFVAVESKRTWTVTYQVSGSGNSAAVRYSVRDGGTTTENVHLPWTKEASFGASTTFVLEVTPAAISDSVACEVRVNGQLVDNATITGAPAVCNGLTPAANRFL
ncbi:MmpS family transport accessory protein [Mycolicibacterium sp. HK-90]|uniref:MmpS family transport accessory protein n=1 Tax=Mycolicibacterium sp. HK-90 TaxID=3056937 RepID=UPI002659054F|nr:MmpS family transport accessory protein [Mycolicibacterium sp. HK-90]WKG01645.1 MmpS family transport accessory protein [Mycolicibacterium sp. HK-90]